MKKAKKILLRNKKENSLVFSIFYQDNSWDDIHIQNHKVPNNLLEYTEDMAKSEEEREGIELIYEENNLYDDYFGDINFDIKIKRYKVSKNLDFFYYKFNNPEMRKSFEKACISYILNTQNNFEKIQNSTKFFIQKNG